MNSNGNKSSHGSMHVGKLQIFKDKRKDKNEDAICDLKERIPDIDRIFDIHGRIGNGTFSTVLLATAKSESILPEEKRRKYAIKHHIPTSHPDRIIKELKCMIDIGGVDNVVGINCTIRNNESVAFVMPFMPHDRFCDFYNRMELDEVQHYMRNLLIAIRRVHKFNIIHRDIKPSNFLYNRKHRKFLLVDFGLAQSVKMDSKTLKRRADSDASCQSVTNIKRVKEEDAFALAKMPLKQINEITTPKSKPTMNNFEAILSREVKSAVLGHTMTNRLQEKMRNNSTTSRQDNSLNYNTNRNLSSSSAASKCYCYGKPKVCNICLVRKEVQAARSGTPGYRPPEVLLKYQHQTTAVDIWAVGVIFLSILSGIYPFFKASDDFVALAEMVTLFGDKAIRKTAFSLDRLITLSQKTKPLDLKKLCVRFRNQVKFCSEKLYKKYEQNGKCEICTNCDQWSFNCLCAETQYVTEPLADDSFPPCAYDLLLKLLEINPHKRITAEEALQHPYFDIDFS